MLLEKGKCTFFIKRPIKTTKPSFHRSPIALPEYPWNRKTCTVTTITHYLEITKDLRITDQPIISYNKPHKAVTTTSIGRWFKFMLGKAGIDNESYSTYSTRSSSTSKVKIKGLSLSEISKAAGWKETSTFRHFYDKPIFKIFWDLVIQWHVMVNQT